MVLLISCNKQPDQLTIAAQQLGQLQAAAPLEVPKDCYVQLNPDVVAGRRLDETVARLVGQVRQGNARIERCAGWYETAVGAQ